MAYTTKNLGLLINFKWQKIYFSAFVDKKTIINNLKLNFTLNEVTEFNFQLSAYLVTKNVLEYLGQIYSGITLEQVTCQIDPEFFELIEKQSSNMQYIQTTIKNLYGHSLLLIALNQEELAELSSTFSLSENPLLLPELSKLQGSINIRLFDQTYKLTTLERLYINGYFNLNQQDNNLQLSNNNYYVKVSLLVGSELCIIMLTKNFIRYFNTYIFGNLPNFSYNEFFTQSILDLLITYINSQTEIKVNTSISLIDTSYIKLAKNEKYIAFTLTNEFFSGSILIASKYVALLELFVKTKLISPDFNTPELLFNQQSKLTLPLIGGISSINYMQLKNLKIGDTLIMDNMHNKSEEFIIDLGNKELVATLNSDNNYSIKHKLKQAQKLTITGVN